MRIIHQLREWYRGAWMENEPGSSIVFMNHRVQPKAAQPLSKVGRFISSEWKWLIGIAVAVSAIVVGSHRH
jgi:hypothetical protein